MDSHRLWGLLIRAQDHLNDDDREKLHCYMRNDVPRRIRDNPTLSGTLNLLESLYERGRFDEDDLTFLIEAFKEIQCFKVARQLKGNPFRPATRKQQANSFFSIYSLSPSYRDRFFMAEFF